MLNIWALEEFKLKILFCDVVSALQRGGVATAKDSKAVHSDQASGRAQGPQILNCVVL